jgi:hypothetical protein
LSVFNLHAEERGTLPSKVLGIHEYWNFLIFAFLEAAAGAVANLPDPNITGRSGATSVS